MINSSDSVNPILFPQHSNTLIVTIGLASVPGLNHPLSLDIFAMMMVWVSQEDGSLVYMDKFGRGINQTLQAGLTLPTSVKVYQNNKYDLSGG